MANPYGITLNDHSLRWAAAEGVSESVIAAICLLGEKTVDEIVARLTTTELEQVIKIAGRSPQVYPPGVCAALKDKRDLALPPQQADSPATQGSAEKAGRTPLWTGTTNEHARRPQKVAALRQRHAVDGEAARPPKKPEHVPERALKLPDGAWLSKT